MSSTSLMSIINNTNNAKLDKDILLAALLEEYCGNSYSFKEIASMLDDEKILSKDSISEDTKKVRVKYISALDSILNKMGAKFPFVVRDYFSKNYKVIKRLGEGGYGSVYHVRHILDGREYAIKQIPLTEFDEKMLREVYFLSRLDHKNIVRYYNAWIENIEVDSYDSDDEKALIVTPSAKLFQPNLMIQMELCNQTLSQFIDQIKKVNVKQINKLFLKILKGVKYIHQNNLMHRDLKPANIFLKNNIIKIGDFGLIRENFRDTHKTDAMVVYKNKSFTDGIGTHIYCSPEQLLGKNYDQSTDIYSLGMIYYELLNSFDTKMERVIEMTKLKESGNVSKKFKEKYPHQGKLIEKMINENYKKRLEIDDIIDMLKN